MIDEAEHNITGVQQASRQQLPHSYTRENWG